MLLPHGYEGQGPEHSSARLERYLQLCAEDNMQVVNCTTPANYFHALRRQMHRNFRKPLIVMTPKSLLRHKLAVSTLAEMGPGTSFHRILWDSGKTAPDDGQVRRVVLCTRQGLLRPLEEREKREITDVLILRVEQLYPFPHKPLKTRAVALSRRRRSCGARRSRRTWAPGPSCAAARSRRCMADMGLKQQRLRYAGRPAAASPATGLLRRHLKEQAELVDEALVIDAPAQRAAQEES